MKLLKNEDFTCVAVLATHCDQNKLCVAEDEALDNDLESLFCSSWDEVYNIMQEVIDYRNALALCNLNPECLEPPTEPENYIEKYKLVYGGNYLSQCGNRNINFKGLIKLLVYYTYARYTIINAFNDTPNGHVTQTNNFSIPKTGKELESFADKYRNMGYHIFKQITGYICTVPNLVYWGSCGKCECGHKDCTGNPVTVNKGFGFSGRVISKY